MFWRHAIGALDCSRGHLVGIVNATPDSFTDEGRHFGTDQSVAHGVALAKEGASVVEVGGESLRFSEPTPTEEEISRVVPVIERLVAELDVPVAVDTYKAPVAAAAVQAGASILNDPTGLRDDAMLQVAADSQVGVVMTHFFGEPKVRPPGFPDVDVLEAITEWAADALARAEAAGVDSERLVIDPGVGLGKSPEQDLDLLHRIGEIVALGRPVFIPMGNKKVIGAVTGALAKERLPGTVAGVIWTRLRGASVFRVHDVAFVRQALTMAEAMKDGSVEVWHEVPK
jgi:dihydropteroate synthase